MVLPDMRKLYAADMSMRKCEKCTFHFLSPFVLIVLGKTNIFANNILLAGVIKGKRETEYTAKNIPRPLEFPLESALLAPMAII